MDMTSLTPYIAGLIIIVIAFLCGVVLASLFCASRKRKDRKAERKAVQNRSAYLTGINYSLSNDIDRAIEELSKAAKMDSDNVEIYSALGDLLRNKGDIDKAIRIHQSITVRPNLESREKKQAYYDLGLDYKKAGLTEKAIASFEALVEMDGRHLDAAIQLVGLYEDSNNWEKAYMMRQKVSKLRGTSSGNNILAHYQTEIAKSFAEKGDTSHAHKFCKKAISLDKNCAEAYLCQGDLYFSEKKVNMAIQSWDNIKEHTPQFAFLAYPRLEEAYFSLDDFSKMGKILRENADKNESDIQTRLALAEHLFKKSMAKEAIKELKTLIEAQPYLITARRRLAEYLKDQGDLKESIDIYESIIKDLPLSEMNFQCKRCGHELKIFRWRCPQCKTWDSIVEKSFKQKREDVVSETAGEFSSGPDNPVA